ncbi:MAG: hypothetical protein OEV92_12985 [Nitrospinota bacterium]|nr:hypothetical protein [Nitrospinota bacterium]
MPVNMIMGVALALLASSSALAYPGAKSGEDVACAHCHDNPQYANMLFIKAAPVARATMASGGSGEPWRGLITLRKGGKASIELVLGAQSGKVNVIGWLWKLPAGITMDAPGGVRKLGQGQPWDEYTDENGHKQRTTGASVISQTFFASPALRGETLEGELYIALGEEDMGAAGLSGVTIKVEFREAP